jgi:hypothetical protein
LYKKPLDKFFEEKKNFLWIFSQVEQAKE